MNNMKMIPVGAKGSKAYIAMSIKMENRARLRSNTAGFGGVG
jgi:hypothetical protein